MSIITILLFFLYTYGFGFILTHLSKVKESEDLIERHIMRIGFGLCAFIVLAVFLNLLHIPLHWGIFLAISLIGVSFFLYKDRANLNSKVAEITSQRLTKKNLIYLALLILFVFNLFMYVKGSFAYEYLEDDDPWTHAREMKFVALEKKLDVGYFRPINYLDPYPPAYASIMGILHQTSPEAQWTIKFFNSLLISLSILFFFFMVKRLTDNSSLALASTFILSMLPSYLSHFIWSHTLIPLLFFLLTYAYLKIEDDSRWLVVSAIITAAIFLTHTRQVIKIGILALFYIGILWAYTKKIPWKVIASGLVGAGISLMWWAFKVGDLIRMVTHSASATDVTGASVAATQSLFGRILARLPFIFSPTGGTGTRAYTFSDFFIAQETNMINAPIGWGIAISLLLLAALIFIAIKYKTLKEKNNLWITLVLAWFIFSFLAVNSATFHLPIGIEAFRTWMFLAIPVSILAGYGIILIGNSAKSLKYPLIIILIILVFLTAGMQKYVHNSSPSWPPGGKWTSGSELSGYLWMKNNLPLNSNVFTYSTQNKVVFGLNMNSCEWCSDYRAFHPTVLEKNVTDVYSWLKAHQYDYIIFGGMEIKYLSGTYGQNETVTMINERLTQISKMPTQFQLVHQEQGFLLFKIV